VAGDDGFDQPLMMRACQQHRQRLNSSIVLAYKTGTGATKKVAGKFRYRHSISS